MHSLLDALKLYKFTRMLEAHGVEFALVDDLKMACTLSGKSHGGKHSCLYCLWTVSQGLGAPSLQLRTVVDDLNDFKRWQSFCNSKGLTAQKSKDCVKSFNNCVRQPLIRNLYPSNNALIIDMSRPAPLHSKLRNGNTLLSDLSRAAPSVHVRYLAACGVVPEKYHNELEGGPISRVLRSVEKLLLIDSSNYFNPC